MHVCVLQGLQQVDLLEVSCHKTIAPYPLTEVCCLALPNLYFEFQTKELILDVQPTSSVIVNVIICPAEVQDRCVL